MFRCFSLCTVPIAEALTRCFLCNKRFLNAVVSQVKPVHQDLLVREENLVHRANRDRQALQDQEVTEAKTELQELQAVEVNQDQLDLTVKSKSPIQYYV